MFELIGKFVGRLIAVLMEAFLWGLHQLTQYDLNDFADAASIAAFFLALWLTARARDRDNGEKCALARRCNARRCSAGIRSIEIAVGIEAPGTANGCLRRRGFEGARGETRAQSRCTGW
jgi:hypothetical protein